MPAGPVGNVWALGAWGDTQWQAGAWMTVTNPPLAIDIDLVAVDEPDVELVAILEDLG